MVSGVLRRHPGDAAAHRDGGPSKVDRTTNEIEKIKKTRRVSFSDFVTASLFL
ncbi:hypothetical protein Hanom_Chr06g00577141 [Helianthus anomalus]